MAKPLIKPFQVDIPKAEVDRLKGKLNDTRLPGRSIVPDAGTNYGSYLSFTPLTSPKLTLHYTRSHIRMGIQFIRGLEK
jgi:hypothetical protein